MNLDRNKTEEKEKQESELNEEREIRIVLATTK